MEPADAMVDGKKGGWTMIYDEGFEVDGDGLEFFAFSKFQLLPASMRSFAGQTAIKSDCSRTEVGWYRDAEKGQFGCYYGTKKFAHGSYVAAEKSMLQTPKSRSYYAALSRKEMQVDVDEVNHRQSDWTAKVYSRFEGKSMHQLNTFAGLQRSTLEPSHRMAAVQKHTRELRGRNMAATLRASFPKSWDWRSVNGSSWLTEGIDQGDCGSCYVISTMRMLTARHRVAKRDPKVEAFSTDFPLHCSEYNQGCKGGYPFLVAKWTKDVGILPESCGSYDTDLQSCSVTCDMAQVNKYKATSFGYVGGYYGAGTELSMMQELQEKGPLVVSLEPGKEFMYYSKGVYKSSPVKHSEWVRVDHSVLLVGWGEEAKAETGAIEKYWIVQNSWGTDWGEDGFFRIDRGENDSGIEAEPLIAEVVEDSDSFDLPYVQQLDF